MLIMRRNTLDLMAALIQVMDEVVDVTGVEVRHDLGDQVQVNFGWAGNAMGNIRIEQPTSLGNPLWVCFDLNWDGGRNLERTFNVSQGESHIFEFIRENLS